MTINLFTILVIVAVVCFLIDAFGLFMASKRPDGPLVKKWFSLGVAIAAVAALLVR